MQKRYLLSGSRICCVVRGSKYPQYAFAPSALHLQHPLSRYVSRKKCCMKSDLPLWELILEGEAVTKKVIIPNSKRPFQQYKFHGEHSLFVPPFLLLWRLCGFLRLVLRENLHITFVTPHNSFRTSLKKLHSRNMLWILRQTGNAPVSCCMRPAFKHYNTSGPHGVFCACPGPLLHRCNYIIRP